jgi:uncharacterized RmlC-like cupin family protein
MGPDGVVDPTPRGSPRPPRAPAHSACNSPASRPGLARTSTNEHESAAYVIEGEMLMWFGEQLEHELVARPGDFMYIPRGVPHLVLNASDTDAAVAVLARTDPNEQEDVTELPELDALERLREAS